MKNQNQFKTIQPFKGKFRMHFTTSNDRLFHKPLKNNIQHDSLQELNLLNMSSTQVVEFVPTPASQEYENNIINRYSTLNSWLDFLICLTLYISGLIFLFKKP